MSVTRARLARLEQRMAPVKSPGARVRGAHAFVAAHGSYLIWNVPFGEDVDDLIDLGGKGEAFWTQHAHELAPTKYRYFAGWDEYGEWIKAQPLQPLKPPGAL